MAEEAIFDQRNRIRITIWAKAAVNCVMFANSVSRGLKMKRLIFQLYQKCVPRITYLNGTIQNNGSIFPKEYRSSVTSCSSFESQILCFTNILVSKWSCLNSTVTQHDLKATSRSKALPILPAHFRLSLKIPSHESRSGTPINWRYLYVLFQLIPFFLCSQFSPALNTLSLTFGSHEVKSPWERLFLWLVFGVYPGIFERILFLF